MTQNGAGDELSALNPACDPAGPDPAAGDGNLPAARMTAVELRAWQRRCGLRTDEQAAAVLGVSVATYRRRRTGETPMTRQTELLACYYEVFSVRVSSIFDSLLRLHRMTQIPIPPAVAKKSVAVIKKLLTL